MMDLRTQNYMFEAMEVNCCTWRDMLGLSHHEALHHQ